MQTDYLLVGQGIAGTLLSWALINNGKNVIVIEDCTHVSASMVCGGIINPVTGKRLVKSWMTEQLLPFALNTYRQIEVELNIPLVREISILDFRPTAANKSLFDEKLAAGNEYLYQPDDAQYWEQFFRFNYGTGGIRPCLLLDTGNLVMNWRNKLKTDGLLLDEKFSWDDCRIEKDKVTYKNLTAGKILFCEGAAGENNPWFRQLPWSKDKGEAIIAEIPGLPATRIYKQNLGIVPRQDGLFWIGATHDWKYTDLSPSPAFRKKVEDELNYWLRLPYKIIDHIVGLRPANFERKPFAGLHPACPSVGILNGMGGKGVAFAPFFAHNLSRYLVHNDPLLPEVDIYRFKKTLEKYAPGSLLSES